MSSEEWAVRKYGSVEDARWDLERDEEEEEPIILTPLRSNFFHWNDDEPTEDVDYDYSTRYAGVDY